MYWNLHEIDNDLPFLLERIEIEKAEKLVINLDDKTEYVTHIGNLKEALNHQLHRIMHRINQIASPKPYIDTNTYLRRNMKILFIL